MELFSKIYLWPITHKITLKEPDGRALDPRTRSEVLELGKRNDRDLEALSPKKGPKSR